MNSYRIDTFRLDDGTWKAAAYECGTWIGEFTGFDEPAAIQGVSYLVAMYIGSRDE